MEEKILDVLEKLYMEVKGINGRLDNVESDIRTLKQGQERIENKLDNVEVDVSQLKQGQVRIESKLDNMEAQNANRHIEIESKLQNMAKDITVVEAVAGKNMVDIANIKLVK